MLNNDKVSSARAGVSRVALFGAGGLGHFGNVVVAESVRVIALVGEPAFLAGETTSNIPSADVDHRHVMSGILRGSPEYRNHLARVPFGMWTSVQNK